MDKLKPILNQRFWILLAVALPMTLFGYFKTNAGLKAKTEERVKALDGVKGKIPGGTEPNDKYEAGLKVLSDRRNSSVDNEIWELWQTQQKQMVWPKVVASYVPDKYWGDIVINGSHIKPARFYIDEYNARLFDEVWEECEPIIPPTATNLDKKWTEKVAVSPDAIKPHRIFVSGNAISIEQMWEAQEDLWLFHALTEVIRKMNERADGPSTATIRFIGNLRLLGGDGKEVFFTDASGGSPGMGGSGMPSPTMPTGGGGMGGGNAPNRVGGPAAFDPAQEFGLDKAADAAGGSPTLAPMTTTLPTMAAAAPVQNYGLRYLGGKKREKGKEPTDPYFERGFYLSVVIQQSKIPDFLTELSNCRFPARIARFQMSYNPYSKDLPVLPFQSKGTAGGAGGTQTPGLIQYSPGPAGDGGRPSSPFLSPTSPDFESGSGSGKGPSLMSSPGSKDSDFDTSALSNPELVMLDVLGAMTIFNKPPAPPTPPAAVATPGAKTEAEKPKADVQQPETLAKPDANSEKSPAEKPKAKLTDDDDEDAPAAKPKAEMPQDAKEEAPDKMDSDKMEKDEDAQPAAESKPAKPAKPKTKSKDDVE